MPFSLEQIAAPVQAALHQVEKTLSERLVSSVETVTQIANHVIASGGKRLRPLLCLLSARLFGPIPPRVILLSCAFELIHTATLLHDDVLDNALMRRGKSSSNSVWGNQSSILVGDYLYCKASTLIAEDGDFEILRIITQATATTTEGEVLEITKTGGLDLTEQEYLKIIHDKTACLMGAATRVGALAAGASLEDQKKLETYGSHLGMAFQLIDDALDYSSSNEEIGKKVGTDLQEGKLTLPLLRTLQFATPSEKKQIHQAFQTSDKESRNLREILTLLEKYQGIPYTLNKAQDQVQKAQQALASFPDTLEKKGLFDLSDYILHRKK